MPNNPTTDVVLLGAVSTVGRGYPTPNTSVLSGNIYVQNLSAMITAGAFPAVHLSTGTQSYTRNSRATYVGLLIAYVDYYDRWDSQPQTIDQVRAGIASDMETWKANLESNDSLTYSGQAHAVSIPQIDLAPYLGEITATAPGYTLVWRRLTLRVNILPYDV